MQPQKRTDADFIMFDAVEFGADDAPGKNQR